jgi:hypothetical protein
MMKVSILSVALSVGLIFAGVAIPANQAKATGEATSEVIQIQQNLKGTGGKKVIPPPGEKRAQAHTPKATSTPGWKKPPQVKNQSTTGVKPKTSWQLNH